jgi:hypothetical protein
MAVMFDPNKWVSETALSLSIAYVCDIQWVTVVRHGINKSGFHESQDIWKFIDWSVMTISAAECPSTFIRKH